MADNFVSGTRPDELGKELTVNLHVLSPSIAANGGDLVFPSLPIETTVRQLKEKIERVLPTRVSPDAQRLIYLGRPLHDSAKTMLEVFGEETIRKTDKQSIHLIIRNDHPTISQHPTTPTTSATATTDTNATTTTTTTTTTRTRQAPPPRNDHPLFLHHLQAFNPPPSRIPPRPSDLHMPPPFQNHQQQQQQPPPPSVPGQQNLPMVRPERYRRDAQTLTEEMERAQNERAMRLLGASAIDQGRGSDGISSAQQQPDGNTRTIVRDIMGPDGQLYHIVVGHTHHRLALPSRPATASGLLSAADVQNVLRDADARQAGQITAHAMQRTVSGASLPRGPGTVHTSGVVNTRHAAEFLTRAGIGRAASDTAVTGGSNIGRQMAAQTQTRAVRQASFGAPELYLLQSPQGPRAVLISPSLDTYFTPPSGSVRTSASAIIMHGPNQRPTASHTSHPLSTHNQQNQLAAPANDQAQPPPQRAARPRRARHAQNVQIVRQQVDLNAWLLQLLPHVWLAIRLGLFIYWFTSPHSSWMRWGTVVGIAVLIFILNTGALNHLADQAWAPVRRHMEHLIPLAEPGRGGGGEAGAQQMAPPPPSEGRDDGATPPHPAQMAGGPAADREQRDTNVNRLVVTARRIERAGLLFLASIAPGVAERHIANLEAERRRRETEAATAAAAAAAMATAAVAADENGGGDLGEGPARQVDDALAAADDSVAAARRAEGVEQRPDPEPRAAVEQLIPLV